mmetsp:Transcript_30371/g.48464  ORF Transcript_30371/g.48464 Transcript_30371/m.48464 type:complete len:153 (+) Transcript_30371:519-977(+)
MIGVLLLVWVGACLCPSVRAGVCFETNHTRTGFGTIVQVTRGEGCSGEVVVDSTEAQAAPIWEAEFRQGKSKLKLTSRTNATLKYVNRGRKIKEFQWLNMQIGEGLVDVQKCAVDSSHCERFYPYFVALFLAALFLLCSYFILGRFGVRTVS